MFWNSLDNLGLFMGKSKKKSVLPRAAQPRSASRLSTSLVPVSNEQTLEVMNSVAPGVIGVPRQNWDGCPDSMVGSTQHVNGFAPGVALPGGLGQGVPSSVSPAPGIPLSLDSDCTRVNSLIPTVPSHDLPPTCSFHHSDICPLSPEDFGELRDIWKLCLIGYTIGRTPGYTILGKYMANAWNCNATLHIHDSGWLIFQFSSASDMGRVLRRGPYSVQGKPLVLKPMPPYFDFGKPDMSSVPVWVRLLNLPLECWSPACLSKISSVIGKHIRCDDLTLSMSRVSFARVMVEVTLTDDLPHSISLSMPDGTIINQKVIYEYKPRFCSFCCITGHTSNVCQKLNSCAEGTSTSGKLKRASGLPSPADDIVQDTGDSYLHPVGVASGSRDAIQGGKSLS